MRITRWDQTLDTETSNGFLRELALWHTSQVVSATTERQYITDCLTSGDFLSVCNYSLDYNKISIMDAVHLRQALALFSKRADLDLGIDREAVAFEKFVVAESLCLETNTILKLWAQGKFHFLPGVDAVFFAAQRKIARVLGDVPSLEALKIRFGPGATTQVIKKNASARRKLSQVFACSEDLLPIVKDCLEEVPGWVPFGESDTALVTVEIHRGKLSFVPKNAKTDRSVVVEPMLNSMFQLAVGSFIGDRLKSVGVDITDQTRNQRLARHGSLTGELATLDLSSASDTIARELVHHLLPPDWAFFLDYLRTSEVEYKGEILKLQKFSSMGNGFTFPLETLIFWALASSCTDAEGQKQVSVYGDDIIVPVRSTPLLITTLVSAGFLLNLDKSFVSGPFRESCGADYLTGINIRPCYIKAALSGSSCFVLHNFYARSYNSDAAAIVLSWIADPLKIWGPDGYGDGHLVGDWQPRPYRRELPPDKNQPGGWAGYTFETYTFKSRKSYHAFPGDYVYPSYCAYVSHNTEIDSYNREGIFGFRQDIPPVTNHRSNRNDVIDQFGVVLPGWRGYKMIKIYTLEPNPVTGW